MARIKLTDSACEKLTAGSAGRSTYFDALITGLALRVTTSNVRTFYVVYRVAGDPSRRKRWLKLGRYLGPARDGTILSLKKARDDARVALATASSGKDPAEEQRLQAAKTVGAIVPQFAKRFLEDGAKKNGQAHAPSYISATKQLLENHVIPRWRDRRITDVTTESVAVLLNAIVDEGKPIAARRVHAALSKLFNWCIGQGLRSDNPVKAANRPGRENKRRRYLSPEEIATIWPCMEKLDATRRKTKVAYPSVGAFCQLLLATGQRRENVAKMRWADIKDGIWTIPRSEMKDSNEDRGDHVVPLSPLAVAVLKRCDRIGEYVFQSTTPRSKDRSLPRPMTGFPSIKRRLDKRVTEARQKDNRPDIPAWTFHDCRRTVGSLMERELDLSPRIIGRVLDHADSGVTESHYLKADLTEKTKQALDAWGAYLSSIVTPQDDGKIVHISNGQPRRDSVDESFTVAIAS